MVRATHGQRRIFRLSEIIASIVKATTDVSGVMRAVRRMIGMARRIGADLPIGVATILFMLLSGTTARAQDEPAFVGGQVCATCHAAEAARWSTSHHARAMQPATPASVLGDFSGARFEHRGVVSTFSRMNDRFQVRTEGPSGTVQDYEIAYTFGVDPLQQYLIAMPGGRLQALGIAWDTRPADQGGQRWFHLYPDQRLQAGNRLHWTGRDQTWNYMCADCHSTGLNKNYDLATNTYATTWKDMNVSCEACHGPGSRHVDWARAAAPDARTGLPDAVRKGLVAWLGANDTGRWQINDATGTATRSSPQAGGELDTCASCHSRRKVIARNTAAGQPFLDAFLPAYLEPGLYHADGQIDGEVFEYGSFVQSRMFRAGVTCSNCHEPHTQTLRAEGNQVCAQCHLPRTFDVTSHHHHQPGSTGAQCVSCHMPVNTYMVVDRRHDHSLRVPRPDLSVSIGTPNACTQCHTEKQPEWAAAALRAWFPNGRQNTPHYGQALHAGRTGAANAEQLLNQLVLDPTQPAIARGSALLLLSRFATPASETAVKAAIADADALVRAAVPRVLPASPSRVMIQAVGPLLRDPVRAVRIAAARALVGVDPQVLTVEQRTALQSAYLELTTAELVDADRPEAHLNLGLIHIRRRQAADAEAAYRTALRLDPAFVPAMVNLADLQRMRGMDQQGADWLRMALTVEPNNADVKHALGLHMARLRNYSEALPLLRRAMELAPDNVHYSYVYAIALNSTGSPASAVSVLEKAHLRAPADREILVALVSIARDRGDKANALSYARRLFSLYPNDPQFRALLIELERQ